MAEERIIDDEYGRGVKLRKTKDGYVDVTDEQVPPETERENEENEEVSFAFPILETEEDDEDLVGLSPEEAAALRKKKAEAAQRRLEEYKAAVAEGDALLDGGDFAAAEKKFEEALQLDEEATDASVGYWRAKTEDFANPDVLMEEYVEAGIESLEYDLGYEAADVIKRKYRPALEKRYGELKAEEAPLAEEVEGKQARRREILKARRKNSRIALLCSGVPFLAFVILAVVFGLKNFSTPDNTYIPVTIVMAALSVVGFIVFAVFVNRFLNDRRMYAKNEKLTATEEGETLFQIREYMDLYEALLRQEETLEEEIEK